MCARRRTHFLCTRQRKQAKKGGPRQQPCTPLRFAPFRANLRGRERQKQRFGRGCKALSRGKAVAWQGCASRKSAQSAFCSRARAGQAHHSGGAAELTSRCALRSDNCRESAHDAIACCVAMAPPPSSPSQTLPQGEGEPGHRCAWPRAGFALLALACEKAQVREPCVASKTAARCSAPRAACGVQRAAGQWSVQRAQKMVNKNCRLRRSLFRVRYLF